MYAYSVQCTLQQFDDHNALKPNDCPVEQSRYNDLCEQHLPLCSSPDQVKDEHTEARVAGYEAAVIKKLKELLRVGYYPPHLPPISSFPSL